MKKYNEGFSLVELLVSIVILAAIVLPTCTSLVLSYRLNAKARELMQAQLAVSSTVETLMAQGVTDEFVTAVKESAQKDPAWMETTILEGTSDQFPGLKFTLEDKGEYYSVKVMDENELVEVNTSIRDKTTGKEGGATQ